jgi:hypothetical protein
MEQGGIFPKRGKRGAERWQTAESALADDKCAYGRLVSIRCLSRVKIPQNQSNPIELSGGDFSEKKQVVRRSSEHCRGLAKNPEIAFEDQESHQA